MTKYQLIDERKTGHECFSEFKEGCYVCENCEDKELCKEYKEGGEDQ